MTWWQAILLGAVQGLGEFLPISSSGHIMFFEQLLNMQIDPNAMMLVTVLLHLGTLLVILIVFWQDWLDILKNLFHSKTLLWLIVASLPALIVKVLLGDLFDRLNAGGMLGIFFLVTALMMALIQRLSGGRHISRSREVGAKHAVTMGCFQALGMMTGISRSGSTTLGGILSGLSRKSAIKFCFMMSAPAVLGSLLVEGKDAYEAGAFGAVGEMIVPILLGIIVAFVLGLLSVRFMLKKIETISYNWFALYMGALGVLTLILQLAGVGAFKPVGLG